MCATHVVVPRRKEVAQIPASSYPKGTFDALTAHALAMYDTLHPLPYEEVLPFEKRCCHYVLCSMYYCFGWDELVSCVGPPAFRIIVSRRPLTCCSLLCFVGSVFPLNDEHACTAGYLSFGPMAQCVVHAFKGLACLASPSRAH